jgi:type II secretory ATPase GspE/PulE/Tfp pilus assembly ATPase PilB-like protein
VYIGMRAASSFEALEQWRKLVGDDSLAVENLKMIVNGRVLRKLCTACKIEFAPDQTMLRKLGMDPEKVTSLYQARTQPLRDPKGNPIVCEFCHDLHFKGRQGVFEVMTMDDEMRLAVTGGKPVEPVFRRQRGRYLQDEALALVEAGQTSIQEIKRVMRPGAAEAPPAGPSVGDGTPPAGTPVRSSGGKPKSPARPARSAPAAPKR